EEDCHLEDGGRGERNDRDGTAASRLGEARRDDDSYQPGQSRGHATEHGDESVRVAVLVGEEPVRELGGRSTEEVREERGQAQQDEPEAIDVREHLTKLSSPACPVREVRVPTRLVEVSREARKQQDRQRADGEDDAPGLRREIRNRQ